jgi:hypothetical protein
MEHAFDRVQTCDMDVTCHITFTKRALRATANWLDAHPKLFTIGLLLAVLGLVGGVVAGAMGAMHALR